MKNYYNILEVSKTATAEDIKRSYRQLALKYHPDKNANDSFAEVKFKEIVEAYKVLSNFEERRNYDLKNDQNNNQTEKKPITPADLLRPFSEARKRVVKLGRSQINETGLYESLNDLLNDNVINFLLACEDNKTNKLIMNEVLICCKYLNYDQAEKLITRLVKIAGSNNDTIGKLHKFSKKLKFWSNWDRFKSLAKIAAIIIFISVLIFNWYNTPITTNPITTNNTPSNGDLNNTFVDNEVNQQLTSEQQLEKKKEELIKEGWQEQEVENGQLPNCYNFKPKKGKTKNYLEVYVGSGTDVSIKVMNKETDKCIRYVFINSGSTYRIINIPEGNYYLKIAYGKNWFSRIENGKCVGKFLRNPLYEKGEDVMNFNIKYTDKGYSVPSFKLELDVIASDISNSFNSQDISEDEFNS